MDDITNSTSFKTRRLFFSLSLTTVHRPLPQFGSGTGNEQRPPGKIRKVDVGIEL